MYASLGYRLQDVDIFNVSSGASAAIQAQKGSFVESEIFTSLVFDRRDNALLTRTGQRVSLSPYVAGGFLGGDTQIYGWDLEGSQYFHFKWDTILLFNGEIATVNQVAAMKFRFSIDSISAAQTTSAALTSATSDRRILTANPSAAKA
jgi:outer membrane protein assembly factor BamA